MYSSSAGKGNILSTFYFEAETARNKLSGDGEEAVRVDRLERAGYIIGARHSRAQHIKGGVRPVARAVEAISREHPHQTRQVTQASRKVGGAGRGGAALQGAKQRSLQSEDSKKSL